MRGTFSQKERERKKAERKVGVSSNLKMFTHLYFSLVFRDRCGFAAAASEANVPIIPMFTENIRENQTIHFFGFRGNAESSIEIN